EPKEPGRRSQHRPIETIQHQVYRHRNEPDEPEFVSGQDAVEDRARPEHDWYPGFRATFVEAKDPRTDDENDPHQVIEHAVNSSRNETHQATSRERSSQRPLIPGQASGSLLPLNAPRMPVRL